MLDEQGRVEAAIECLRIALRVAPDYTDAMFNLALVLQRTNQYAEAAGGLSVSKTNQRRYTRFNDFVFGGSLFFGT